MAAALPSPRFDEFYRYDALTELLFAYAEARPNLVSVRSIGKSHEGRDIWVLVLTNTATGADVDKPAFWLDGNIHAAELSASTACLFYLNDLLNKYGLEPQVTQLLDTRVIYMVPRLNPDGAELALADRPRHIRSSTRRYPYDEEPVDGLNIEDVDGDGRILTMRVPDPHGGYKKHAGDPRLMVAREPGEFGGEYYRLIPEGFIKHHDGLTVTINPDREGLDLNRNFRTPGWDHDAPLHWQRRAHKDPRRWPGPSSLSEPETRFLNSQIESFKPQLVVSIHAPYGLLDFDGPMAPPRQLGALRLEQVGVFPGSLGYFGGLKKGLPVVTIELPNALRMPKEGEQRDMWADLLRWMDAHLLTDVREAHEKPEPGKLSVH